MEYKGKDSYVPHHFCVVSDFCLSHSSCSSQKRRSSRGLTERPCIVLVNLFIQKNKEREKKVKVIENTRETIPTRTVLDCCYTWLCFTTWICVFYVLTSGCLYSVLLVIISPSVYAFMHLLWTTFKTSKAATYMLPVVKPRVFLYINVIRVQTLLVVKCDYSCKARNKMVTCTQLMCFLKSDCY